MSEKFMPPNNGFRPGDRVCHVSAPEVVHVVTDCEPGVVMDHRHYFRTKAMDDKKQVEWVSTEGWSIYKEQP